MLKRILPGLILSASIAGAGVAHAQGAPSAASGTPTTRPSMQMPMASGNMAQADRASSASFTPSEIATIGAGVVVGAVLFQGAMWHGMTLIGAAIGGWVGDYVYKMHTTEKAGT